MTFYRHMQLRFFSLSLKLNSLFMLRNWQICRNDIWNFFLNHAQLQHCMYVSMANMHFLLFTFFTIWVAHMNPARVCAAFFSYLQKYSFNICKIFIIKFSSTLFSWALVISEKFSLARDAFSIASRWHSWNFFEYLQNNFLHTKREARDRINQRISESEWALLGWQ